MFGDNRALLRLVIGQMQHAQPRRQALPHRRHHGTGNVVAMDAAEGVAGFDHPPGAAAAQIVEHRTAGAVDSRHAEQIDRQTA